MAKQRRLFWMLSAGVFALAVAAMAFLSPAVGQPGGKGAKGGKVKGGIPVGQPDPNPDPKDPKPKANGNSTQYGAISLKEKPEYSDFLAVAIDCIKDGAYGDAAKALQAILNSDEDFFVRVVDEDPVTLAKTDRWASVKYEANRLLGTMPTQGQKVYQDLFGRVAEIEVEKAQKADDVPKLAETAQKYFHTKAGLQANDMLATYFLDSAQFFQAALLFDRMMTLSSKQSEIKPLTLFKAAITFRRTGDVQRSEDIWKQLLPQLEGAGGLQIGKQKVGIEKLQQILKNTPKPQMLNPRDWSLVRGNLTNTAQTIGSPPLLSEMLWKRPIVRDKSEVTGELDPDGGVPDLISKAKGDIRSLQNVPLMSGFFPLAIEGKLIYRTYSGMTAVHLQDVKDDKGNVIEKAGQIAWKGIGFDGGLALSLSNSQLNDKLKQWIGTYQGSHREFMNFVYENTLVGTLSADLKQVYAVDDLAIPVPPAFVNQIFGGNPNFGIPGLPKDIKDRVLQNSLQAYNIHTGKNAWTLGHGDRRKHGEFEDSLFLGPPLPVAGKLFVLNERANGELRLLGIDPVAGTVLSEQKLGTVEDQSRFVRDPNRRIHAVHMAYGEGILVCPTNSGYLMGIDLLSKSLAWAYPYREGKQAEKVPISPIQPFPNPKLQQLPLLPSTWKVAPPAIDKGKVVFTAPDAKSLHCVNLRDGTMAWKKNKTDSDLFMAGAWNGRVLVVTRNSCYALDMHNKGNLLWEVTTGAMPSGQGVASKNIYYLPLSNGEIVAIDVEKGAVTARNRPSSGNAPVAGNLVFHEDVVVSQTEDEIVVYPQLVAKLEVITKEAEKFPADLAKQLYLSELQLANGEVQKAIDLMYKVKAKNPPADLEAKLKQKMYEGLTDLFQVNFKKARADYLKDYEALLEVPDDLEKQKRKATFYRLLGAGLEEEQDLVGAFDAYRKFGSLPLFQKEGIPAKDDPLRKIPAQVWFRGRLSAMFKNAKPEQKKPLLDKIEQDWLAVAKAPNLDEIRSFVAMFDAKFKVGQLARLKLANTLMDRGSTDTFLEAELNLEQLLSDAIRDDKTGKSLAESPDPGGQALEALARLQIQKRSMKLAVDYYRQLAEQFPKDIIRDGKTGKELFDEVAAKKIMLPFIEQAGPLWGGSKFKYRELGSNAITSNLAGQMLIPKGDLNPNSAQLRLILEPLTSSPKLRLVDLASNKDVWTEYLTLQDTNSQIALKSLGIQGTSNQNAYQNPKAYCRFAHTKGHLAVIQVGTMAYALDLSKPGILWKHSLITEALPNNMYHPQSFPALDGHGHLDLTCKILTGPIPRTVQVRVGYVAAVQASYVAVVQGDQLVVIDPLSDKTSKVLWTRSNISEDTHVFGDDQFIYLVDVNPANGVASNSRALFASDGTPVTVPDFSAAYYKRLHIQGGRILAAFPGQKELVVRLVDLPSGKDIWKQSYHPDTSVLKTVDPTLTGVIEPTGKMTVMDLKTQKVAALANLLHGRITKESLKNLHQPLLLADRDYFYVALNHPIDANLVNGGQLATEFGNGLRCETVNGWFGAFHRKDGSKKVDGKEKKWTTGDLHWYSSEPIANQLVVVEHFDQLPLLLFSVRYNEKKPGPFGSQWVSKTQSLDKSSGKWVYYPFTPRLTNGVSPRFHLLTVDPKAGTINLIGFSLTDGILQYYLDDGRIQPVAAPNPAPPPNPGPVAVVPQLPAVTIKKLELYAVKFANVPPGSTVKISVPGQNMQLTIHSGNPVTITFPGQQPIPLQQYLNEVKKQ